MSTFSLFLSRPPNSPVTSLVTQAATTPKTHTHTHSLLTPPQVRQLYSFEGLDAFYHSYDSREDDKGVKALSLIYASLRARSVAEHNP